MVPDFMPSTAQIVAGLLWVTSPIWGGMLAGGIASRRMPFLKTFDGLLVGFAAGFVIIFGMVVVGLALVTEDWSFSLPGPTELYPFLASVVVTLGVCWMIGHRAERNA